MIKSLLSFGLKKGAGALLPRLLGTFGLGKIQLIVLAVLLAALAGQALAIKYLWNEREGLQVAMALEQTSHQSTKMIFLDYKQNAERSAKQTARAVTDLAASQHRAQGEINKLRKLLQRHDLGELARAKPGLIERKANRATADLFSKISIFDPWYSRPESAPGTFYERDPWNKPEPEVIDYAYAWIVDHINRMGHPCWLLYTSFSGYGRCVDGRPAPDLPAPLEARPDTPGVQGPGPGARGDMRKQYRRSQGPILSQPKAIRYPGGRPDRAYRVPTPTRRSA